MDISAADIGGSNTVTTTQGVNIINSINITTTSLQTVNQNMDALGTARLRLGIAPADRVLVYVTGGVALGHVKYSSAQAGLFADRESVVQTGWVVGAGSEWAFFQNWSVKGEFLHYDLGSHTLNANALTIAPSTVSNKFEDAGNIIRVGFNYRLD